MNQASLSSSPTGFESGLLTLRQAADALGSSTTTLRKLIRQGRLPEAEKVETPEGRIWAIPADAIAGIGEREGLAKGEIDLTSLVETTDTGDFQEAASLEAIGEAVLLEPDTTGSHAVEPVPPSLAEVIDAAFLETLLGAKASEAEAMVVAERHRVEFDSLAARQLEVERRLTETDDERRILAERLHSETLARAIADARVTELRDQLQREITYAEAERYERRQAVAREASASLAAAELKSALGWRARRRLARRTAD